MSAERAPPLIAVAQKEGDNQAPVLHSVGAPAAPADEDEEEFIDNYEMLTGNNDNYTLSEKLVHHCGGAILPVHWTACKAVLAFHAGSGVSKLKTTTKKDKEAACLELYYNTIESLDPDHFDKAAREFFCHSFQKKNEPMPAHSLYRYYHDSRAKVRNAVLPYFPRNLVTMKSGRGFHESCNEVYVKAFRQEMSSTCLKDGTPKYTKDEIDDMLPPLHWEFTKSPWYFGLLVKIFRRDPQLALHVADVMSDSTNHPLSRALMRRHRQETALQKHNNKMTGTIAVDDSSTSPSPAPTDSSVLTAASDVVSVTPSANVSMSTAATSMMPASSAHQDKLLWAKVMASKAHAETANVAKRMGKMEELEKGMALLKEMRPVIGEEMYANGVRSLYAALPNFGTFDRAVEIIDVDSTPAADRAPAPPCDDVECVGTTKRRLSLSSDNNNEEGFLTTKRMKGTSMPETDDNTSDVDDVGLDDEQQESNENEGGRENTEKQDYVGFLSAEDEEKYITYHDIVDATGKVVAVHAVDSRAPEDAADNQAPIPFVEVKDKNGNVIRRIYGDYEKKK